MSTNDGYREWATNYDEGFNPAVAMEEPIVQALLGGIQPGFAADVAAGTGRHARRMAVLGHKVVAVDNSPEMLKVLLAKCSRIEGRIGRLEHLPFSDAELDLLVCSLALTHVQTLGPVMREFSRVLKPAGRAILSDIHPLVAATGGQAYYRTANGDRRFIRNHVHWPSEYFDAFRSARLTVRDFLEPPFGGGRDHLLSPGRLLNPEIARLAFGGLPALLVWRLEKAG
jgi:ubiquinone/menaquinone biosynthesis C-methylase UbiE